MTFDEWKKMTKWQNKRLAKVMIFAEAATNAPVDEGQKENQNGKERVRNRESSLS